MRRTSTSRLKNTDVLFGAVADGTAAILWEKDTFAYAGSYVEIEKRYAGLIGGRRPDLINFDGFVVKPEVARAQRAAEEQERGAIPSPSAVDARLAGTTVTAAPQAPPLAPTLFWLDVGLDPL